MADTQVFAWTGTDNRLNVQIGTGGTKPLNEHSCSGPAIAYINGVYLSCLDWH